MPKAHLDLYEREMARYRETIRLDADVSLQRYGATLLHSLNPAEKASLLKELGVEPKNAHDFHNLGVAAAGEENWDQAVGYFKKAIEADSELIDSVFNLALCYEKTGMLPQAKATWQSYLSASEDEEEKADVQAHVATLK